MKVSKEARRTARQLYTLAFENGRLSDDRVRTILGKLRSNPPRNYAGVLMAFERLVRLEKERHHAVVESSTDLSDSLRAEITESLVKKYGDQVTFEYKVNPDLIGGVRVKLGSNVWDGSVKARLDSLAKSFGV
ncbi:ATP synthase F1 subunit delta [Sulfuriroseicoccus oceanibius]|uniref:ATP synthase subunit delta n=1 Tax=Sulfuriroseicoccus oceanibius TaxID=2707525 RepID=A0A6B3L0I2_9BACT|nr:ATP synthase F1 subunit delta [Sulfuriroseicoccus oceanibius]QQL43880.1 ATP synthase F1 subunit delta [Sulfuriroseicoccus oceanibius]